MADIETKKVLRMTFETADGGSMSMSLNDPREDVTGAEIEAVMDTVITKNIFQSSGGDLIAKKDAKIIDTTTNDMYNP
jgi:hypothetical protein